MGNVEAVGVLIVCVLLYFGPTLIALSLRHPRTKSIVLMNIFAGWTLLGWLVAFYWAMTGADEKVWK